MKALSKKLAKLLAVGVLVAGATVGISAQAQAADYAVVVNAANAYSADEADMKNVVKRIYLKQQTSWPNGTEGEPFAREDSSAEQTAFNAAVLGMDAAAHSDYWIKLKQTEGSVAPRSVGASSILMRQIARKPGGFGVVAASEPLVDGVKVLFKFSN